MFRFTGYYALFVLAWCVLIHGPAISFFTLIYLLILPFWLVYRLFAFITKPRVQIVYVPTPTGPIPKAKPTSTDKMTTYQEIYRQQMARLQEIDLPEEEKREIESTFKMQYLEKLRDLME